LSTIVPAHRVIGADDAPHTAFVLHGILGTGRNFTGIARALVAAADAWRFVLIDHRNHGASEDPAAPHGLADVAGDVDALARELAYPPDAIIGHSYGGKVALTYAAAHGDQPLDVWVIDSALGAQHAADVRDGEVLAVLDALRATPGPFAKRGDAARALVQKGVPEPIAKWLSMSVRSGRDGFSWRFDLTRIEEMIEDYYQTDQWPLLEGPLPGRHIHIVRGTRSGRWTSDDIERLETLRDVGAIEYHELDAGHWVHVDAPEGLIDIIAASLA